MLFKSTTLERIRTGHIDVAFRRWKRPTVKAGGTLVTPIGQLAITSLTEVREEEISNEDLRRAGYSEFGDLITNLSAEGSLYRIEFKISGADPRLQLREQLITTKKEFDDLATKLERMDSRAEQPWTREFLILIDQNPRTLAGKLADEIEMPKMDFKNRVRRLKNLGLTISHQVGYSLSPRGKSYLKWLADD